MRPHAIETEYNGYLFRSRLEARWAVFFDTLGIPWEYEKEGYELAGAGRYLPDFWLPTVTLRGGERGRPKEPGLWIEIKGQSPSPTENRKCEALCLETGRPVVLFVGLPRSGWVLDDERVDVSDSGFEFSLNPPEWRDDPEYDPGPVGWDNGMSFMQCHSASCREVKIDFRESSYATCSKCGGTADPESPWLNAAYAAARKARFDKRR